MSAWLKHLWFERLSPREQVEISVLGVLVLLMALWFGLVRPLGSALDRAEARLDAAGQSLGDVRGQIALLTAKGAPAARQSAQPVDAVLTRTSAAAGLTLADSRPADGGRQITLAPAPAQQVMAWLTAVDAELTVRGVSLARTGDGQVTARVMVDER